MSSLRPVSSEYERHSNAAVFDEQHASEVPLRANRETDHSHYSQHSQNSQTCLTHQHHHSRANYSSSTRQTPVRLSVSMPARPQVPSRRDVCRVVEDLRALALAHSFDGRAVPAAAPSGDLARGEQAHAHNVERCHREQRALIDEFIDAFRSSESSLCVSPDDLRDELEQLAALPASLFEFGACHRDSGYYEHRDKMRSGCLLQREFDACPLVHPSQRSIVGAECIFWISTNKKTRGLAKGLVISQGNSAYNVAWISSIPSACRVRVDRRAGDECEKEPSQDETNDRSAIYRVPPWSVEQIFVGQGLGLEMDAQSLVKLNLGTACTVAAVDTPHLELLARLGPQTMPKSSCARCAHCVHCSSPFLLLPWFVSHPDDPFFKAWFRENALSRLDCETLSSLIGCSSMMPNALSSVYADFVEHQATAAALATIGVLKGPYPPCGWFALLRARISSITQSGPEIEQDADEPPLDNAVSAILREAARRLSIDTSD